MKITKIFLPVFMSLVLIVGITQPLIKTSENISDKVFRLHILANSDSTYDQNLKLGLKNYILENTFISKELYEKNERSQFYLTAQELFHYGIIDEIIDEVKIPSICKKCLLRRECENCIDYAYENITEDFSCEDFEPDV